MATNRAGDEVDLTTWIGRTESTADVVAPTPVAALHATLDYPVEAIAAGTALPPLWHWLYFLPMHRQSEIGPDGHAKRGGFLPPVPLPRRMWAGSQFEFRAPVRVGDDVDAHVDDRRRVGQGRPHRPARVRQGAARGALQRRERRRRSSSSTTSSTAKPSGPTTSSRRRSAADAGRRVAARDRAGRRAAVPLLGAHLQRPPHPLRPQVRHRGRGLPRPDRARPADRDAADGPGAPQRAGRRCRDASASRRCGRPST